jgi:hypothetical protein
LACLHLKTPSCFYLKQITFRRLDSISFFRKNLLSWAQSIELVPISGHLCQHKVGYTSQTQHKPSARAKKTLTYLKTLHVRGLAPDNYQDRNHRWRETIFLIIPTQKTNFPLNLHLTELQFLDSCCYNGSSDGKDVQAELGDRMVYQRHVS